MSIEDTERESAAVSKGAPRVTLAEMESKILSVVYLTGADAAKAAPQGTAELSHRTLDQLSILTLAIVIMQNGFMVVGKSAPASVGNFDAAYGRRLAYDDAIRQLWRLEGYALREKLGQE